MVVGLARYFAGGTGDVGRDGSSGGGTCGGSGGGTDGGSCSETSTLPVCFRIWREP